MSEGEIIALIRRRRGQVLVHSYIYYELNENIWSDLQYDKIAQDLRSLQSKYKKLLPKILYEKEQFEKWQSDGGTSGYNFIYSDRIKAVAASILRTVYGHKGIIIEARKKGRKKAEREAAARERSYSLF